MYVRVCNECKRLSYAHLDTCSGKEEKHHSRLFAFASKRPLAISEEASLSGFRVSCLGSQVYGSGVGFRA